MQSTILSQSIYQHSGETEKVGPVAQQASVNEDQEQRRRQLDSRGEKQKIVVAKEVAHEFGGRVHLKQVIIVQPVEPILQQAQSTASSMLHSAIATGKSILNSASAATGAAADKVSIATKEAADKVSIATKEAADKVSIATKEAANTATHLRHDAAIYMSSATKNAAEFVTHAAHEAAHQDLAGKVADTTSHAAEVVSHKTKELAEAASSKAHQIADNISHFTTLVGVLADEENERARRLHSGDEARAASNAFRVSALIRDIGEDFYTQKPNMNYATKLLEEAERRWRLNSTHSSIAEANAHLVGRLVSNNLQNFMPRQEWVRAHINTIEEKERTRRLNDPDETYAVINALNVSELLRDLDVSFYRQTGAFDRNHSRYATTLLEENERRNRIREDKMLRVEDSAHLLMDVVANNIEKFSYSTRHAARFATEFANLISRQTLKVTSTFTSATKDLAKNTALRVRSTECELAHFSSIMCIVALEEGERARRLSDASEIVAMDNAWRQSQLIRDLPELYTSSSVARYPLNLIEESERQWRMACVTPSASRSASALVLANAAKLEAARTPARLNVAAPAFIPHQPLLSKAEPAPVQRSIRAAGAQL